MFCLDCTYQWNIHLFYCAIRIIHSAESNIRVEQYNFQKNKKRFQNLRVDFESLIPFRNLTFDSASMLAKIYSSNFEPIDFQSAHDRCETENTMDKKI